MGRDLFMIQGQYGFDQAGDPCRRFQMANIALHRTDNQWARIFIPVHHRLQRMDLYRIAEACARAMSLDIAYIGRFHAGVG